MAKVQIFFVKAGKHDPIGHAITYFGKLKTGAAEMSHVGFLVDEIYTIESLFIGGIRHQTWETAYKNRDVEVWDIDEFIMPHLWRVKLICDLNAMVGSFSGLYGFSKIPLQIADALLSYARKKPTFFFTKLSPVKYFPICSYLVGWGLWNFIPGSQRNDFRRWRCYSPDDLHDIFEELHYVKLVEKRKAIA